MKLITLMLGLSLALGCVVLADDAPAPTKATTTKTKKTKKPKALKTPQAKPANGETR